ncbi:hypothetical protein [Pseudobacteroides cellulosolvens]|uniref:hypothetical protein n=1 Tax=Pseudobacteroides cellulosolvens TaxID=35825 RepID=UPI00128EBA32|nr:hypothetical protein [Pseudobacteroides cellulosolvens]
MAIITSILPVAVSKAAHKPIPLISKGVPAFASVGTASDANDENYGTSWKGNPPGWLAYDLSIVPESQRIKVQDG